MQDFRNLSDHVITRLPRETAPTPVPNEYGGIYDKPKAPKIGFFKARMNKDNFWNVVFLVATSLCIMAVQYFIDIIPLGILLLFGTVVAAPYLISKINPVEYREGKFHSAATGFPVIDKLPEFIGVVLWSGIPLTIFGALFIHTKAPSLDENLAIYNTIFWFVPTMYFILKNCPISIIFNKKAWIDYNTFNSNCSNNKGNNYSNGFANISMTTNSHHSNSMSNPRNLYFNPSYGSYSGNSFNR